MEFESTDSNILPNMNTILLNTILNMLIAGAVNFLINLKILTETLTEALTETLTKTPTLTDTNVKFLAEYYWISIAALFLCYVFVQLVSREGITKELILYFEKLLPYNLLVTAFLLSLVMYPHFFGNYLSPFMTISMIFNIVIPSVIGIFLCFFLLYERFLLIITRLNQGRNEQKQ